MSISAVSTAAMTPEKTISLGTLQSLTASQKLSLGSQTSKNHWKGMDHGRSRTHS
jgi:hypothetical protein